jgi:hypothetical protein
MVIERACRVDLQCQLTLVINFRWKKHPVVALTCFLYSSLQKIARDFIGEEHNSAVPQVATDLAPLLCCDTLMSDPHYFVFHYVFRSGLHAL